jgi:hypothetical protein
MCVFMYLRVDRQEKEEKREVYIFGCPPLVYFSVGVFTTLQLPVITCLSPLNLLQPYFDFTDNL